MSNELFAGLGIRIEIPRDSNLQDDDYDTIGEVVDDFLDQVRDFALTLGKDYSLAYYGLSVRIEDLLR